MSACQEDVFRDVGEAAGAHVSLRMEEMEMSVALMCRIASATSCSVLTPS